MQHSCTKASQAGSWRAVHSQEQMALAEVLLAGSCSMHGQLSVDQPGQTNARSPWRRLLRFRLLQRAAAPHLALGCCVCKRGEACMGEQGTAGHSRKCMATEGLSSFPHLPAPSWSKKAGQLNQPWPRPPAHTPSNAQSALHSPTHPSCGRQVWHQSSPPAHGRPAGPEGCPRDTAAHTRRENACPITERRASGRSRTEGQEAWTRGAAVGRTGACVSECQQPCTSDFEIKEGTSFTCHLLQPLAMPKIDSREPSSSEINKSTSFTCTASFSSRLRA